MVKGGGAVRSWRNFDKLASIQPERLVDGKEPGKGSATAPVPGLDEVVSMTLRASNPRRVGLHEMVWGLGGRNASQVDGCRESRSLLASGVQGAR